MKHVYPPRHPAWLDDAAKPVPPAEAGSPPAVPTHAPDEAGSDGGNSVAGQPAEGARKSAVDDGAAPGRRP